METPSQISAIARLFSSAVIKEMARHGKSATFARLSNEVRFLTDGISVSPSVASFFESAFATLKRTEHRHEYIYKAALTDRVLLGRHSLKTASMLTEFRVNNCKADLAILNGTATVYEIKSERDSLARLEAQVAAYERFFAKVYVISGENHAANVASLVSNDVGILVLGARGNIKTLREAVDKPERTCPIAILDSIRTTEAVQILKCLGLRAPEVPNTELRAALIDQFKALEPTAVHASMVRTLKKTRNLLPLSNLLEGVPASLRTAALTIPLRKADHSRLLSALNTPLERALCWN